MSSLKEEISKRRTFAIISHPDAGKTTLTEKLLLYGGAINLAGSVKGKRTAKHAVSDWMEIEKQRGISVTSSVLQFKYNGYCINILDTPGHEDFSEDTYRTLMAADSAVMVIDGSKGVEKQTIKLFKVCVMRNIPIITFINKMDRDAKNSFDLLEDIENVLGIHTYPVNWPIGSGKEFKGVYDRNSKKILAFTANNGQKEVEKKELTLDDPALEDTIGYYHKQDLFDEIELLDGAGDEFDLEAVRNGQLTPVFFGSALTNFGVEPFLEQFLQLTTSPLPRETVDEKVEPMSDFLHLCVFAAASLKRIWKCSMFRATKKCVFHSHSKLWLRKEKLLTKHMQATSSVCSIRAFSQSVIQSVHPVTRYSSKVFLHLLPNTLRLSVKKTQ